MTERSIHVHKLPTQIDENDLAGSTVIVVDLLRASTTICQALASGASDVVPFLEVADALAAAAKIDRSSVVLGGERGGRIIDGFDLGNSPAEYTPGTVAGRRVFFTTTNGTRALRHAHTAQRVVVGAIVNLSPVVASVKDCPRVDILCAGTAGRETREDILAAGAMVHSLCQTETKIWQVDEGAASAGGEWQSLLAAARAAGRTPSDELALELRDTPGGRNLLAIGLDADLVACAQIDALDVVPEFVRANGRIHL